jgi:hypothetical protein
VKKLEQRVEIINERTVGMQKGIEAVLRILTESRKNLPGEMKE